MRKIVSLSLAAVFVLTAAMFSSCGGSAEKETPKEPVKISGNVLVISPSADDPEVNALTDEIEALGATVKTQSYAEIAETGLDTSADVIVNATGDVYSPTVLASVESYIGNGGNYLVIGDSVFTSKAHLSDGKYVTEDEILKNGNVIFAPETDVDIELLSADSDTTPSYPNYYSVGDYGSGYGNSLKVTTGLLRSKNTLSTPVSFGDENAILLRFKPNHSYSDFSVIMTLEDGSQYYYSFMHVDNSDEWRNITIYAEDFQPCTAKRVENFSFSQVKTLTFGFDKKVGTYTTGTGIIYFVDSITAFRADKAEHIEVESTVNGIFPRSYCEKYSEQEIKSISYGEDHTGSADLSGISLERGFVFLHSELNPDGNTTRIQSLLTADCGDLAWICDRADGGRVAVIGSSDEDFLNKIGYSVAAETVVRMLKPSAITSCPEDFCYCTESGGRTLDYSFKTAADETNARLSVTVANANGDILSTSDETEKGENGIYRANITLSPDIMTVNNGDTVTVTASLTVGVNNAEADRAQTKIRVVTERKDITIAAVGDSITYGSGSDDPATMSYAKQMEAISGKIRITGENYGLPAASALVESDLPYVKSENYTASLETKADYVFILFGANDVGVWTDGGREHFKEDYSNLVRQYMSLEQKPQIILGITIPRLDSDTSPYYLREEPNTSIKALIEEVAEELSLPVIDLYPYFIGGEETVMSERIHPNADGYNIIAHAIYDKISSMEEEE